MNANSKSIPKAENIRVHSRLFAVSESLVDRILAAKPRDADADTSALEREIASQPRRVFPKPLTVAFATSGDELVYALYGLTPEEIQIVEGDNMKVTYDPEVDVLRILFHGWPGWRHFPWAVFVNAAKAPSIPIN